MAEPIIVQATYENGVLRPARPLGLSERQVVQISLDPEALTGHPHVARTPGVCGGRPIVQGTRIPVKVLVGYHRMGYSPAEILAGFPDLAPAQLHDALSYYYDHQAESDADMEADELPAVLERFHLDVETGGMLRPKG
jgi:uncharacterized protein (DUF433 family)